MLIKGPVLQDVYPQSSTLYIYWLWRHWCTIHHWCATSWVTTKNFFVKNRQILTDWVIRQAKNGLILYLCNICIVLIYGFTVCLRMDIKKAGFEPWTGWICIRLCLYILCESYLYLFRDAFQARAQEKVVYIPCIVPDKSRQLSTFYDSYSIIYQNAATDISFFSNVKSVFSGF